MPWSSTTSSPSLVLPRMRRNVMVAEHRVTPCKLRCELLMSVLLLVTVLVLLSLLIMFARGVSHCCGQVPAERRVGQCLRSDRRSQALGSHRSWLRLLWETYFPSFFLFVGKFSCSRGMCLCDLGSEQAFVPGQTWHRWRPIRSDQIQALYDVASAKTTWRNMETCTLCGVNNGQR